jgi:hypothetical protein
MELEDEPAHDGGTTASGKFDQARPLFGELAELVGRLRAEHEEYERASQSWTREATERKRELRGARARTVLDIQRVLVRLGETDRFSDLDRLPFDEKLARLDAFLSDATHK